MGIQCRGLGGSGPREGEGKRREKARRKGETGERRGERRGGRAGGRRQRGDRSYNNWLKKLDYKRGGWPPKALSIGLLRISLHQSADVYRTV